MKITKQILIAKTKGSLVNLVLKLQDENQKLHSKITLIEMRLKNTFRKSKTIDDEPNPATLQFGNAYPLSDSWINKILFVLKQVKRPMRSAEIILVLTNNDRLFRTFKNKEKYLSTYLTRAKNSKRIIVTQSDGEKSKWYELP